MVDVGVDAVEALPGREVVAVRVFERGGVARSGGLAGVVDRGAVVVQFIRYAFIH